MRQSYPDLDTEKRLYGQILVIRQIFNLGWRFGYSYIYSTEWQKQLSRTKVFEIWLIRTMYM
ncbi:MAG: hypothetical protein RIA63_03260, partial [Cyclobacteriaceae bacterium]